MNLFQTDFYGPMSYWIVVADSYHNTMPVINALLKSPYQCQRVFPRALSSYSSFSSTYHRPHWRPKLYQEQIISLWRHYHQSRYRHLVKGLVKSVATKFTVPTFLSHTPFKPHTTEAPISAKAYWYLFTLSSNDTMKFSDLTSWWWSPM